jgi:hypothetical protein
MGEETSEEVEEVEETEESEDEPTFCLELSAGMLYSLNTILDYNTINMEHPSYAMIAQAIAKDVNDIMSSEEFQNAMEDEIDEVTERAQMQQSQSMSRNFNGRGVQ